MIKLSELVTGFVSESMPQKTTCSVCGKDGKCLPVYRLHEDSKEYFKNHLNKTDFSQICSDCSYFSIRERTGG